MTGGAVRLAPHPQADGVWVVTLAHPGRLNAMSRTMWGQLRSVFDSSLCSVEARCVLIRGETTGGRSDFCAGGDIAEYPGFRFDAQQLRRFHEDEVWAALAAMLACDVPLVAEIHGACMGAGLEIAACCDLRLAADNARFGAPIARLGFPMAPREAALLLRTAGAATLREMLLTAGVLDAAALQARGFVQRVLPPDELADAVLAAARQIAALAPAAARCNKATLRAIESVVAAIDAADPASPLHADAAYAYADTAEHREGIGAFLAKRQPHFPRPL